MEASEADAATVDLSPQAWLPAIGPLALIAALRTWRVVIPIARGAQGHAFLMENFGKVFHEPSNCRRTNSTSSWYSRLRRALASSDSAGRSMSP